jgi:hypothetical protein
MMWRSIFLAIGITLCVFGVECLFIEEAVLAKPIGGTPLAASVATTDGGAGGGKKEIKTQEWMPWSFLGGGAVIILYTITIPRRFQTG